MRYPPIRNRGVNAVTDHAERLNLNVLIAEDDSIARNIVQAYCESLGCCVRLAKNGEQAIGAAGNCASWADVIILDAHMPGPKPCDLYDQVRAAAPDVPILICSALSEWDPRLDFIVEHDLLLLMKPFEHSELRQAIENVLDEQRAVAALS